MINFHIFKNFISFENIILLAFLGVSKSAPQYFSTEAWPNFYNLWSMDVKDLQDFDFKTTNSCIKCPRIYYPICGTDHITYTNECQMACLNYLWNRTRVNMSRTGHCEVFPEQAT